MTIAAKAMRVCLRLMLPHQGIRQAHCPPSSGCPVQVADMVRNSMLGAPVPRLVRCDLQERERPLQRGSGQVVRSRDGWAGDLEGHSYSR